ncbi:CheR family methyltransferase [Desulfospira joergensenii]|uniref:CheR family methyltransferase n=1 Tax=Desulfospira joergensenii TaxID=53329 RepID=UPI0003B388EB|nr:CheR family methyltransferase [Desulfospira joergensenii]
METIPSFETLAEKFLGTGFPPHLSGAVSLAELPPDTQGFVLRVLDLMKRSKYCLTEFNPVLLRWLSVTIPGILPGAWGGRIPPITASARHRKLDDYLAGQDFGPNKGQNIFVDMGCGFPPLTTADTAGRFPGWKIYGVDRSFADYVVYDTRGNYACFSREGEFLYFQPSMDLAVRARYSDPRGTKNRFNQLFTDLLPLLRNINIRTSETVEKDGNKLIHHHILDFETRNLRFIKSDIMDLKPMAAKVFRCMNVFVYFTRDIKKKVLGQIKNHLKNKGLAIIGTNSFGIQSRYAVYKKESNGLFLREFAFSLDNLGHISLMPWFTVHGNDPEAILLAKLSHTIRSHACFWAQFSRHLDQLMESHGFCKRKPDGFLHFPNQEMLPNDFLEKNGLVWREMEEKGYTKGTIDVLSKAGYEAWINSAGDIAIQPPVGALS